MGFTNATNNIFPPTTLQPLYRIWRDWCIGDSLGYMNDNFLYLETLVNTLSAIQTNLLPGIAKAWINFDGTRNAAGVSDTNNTPRYIWSSYNVSSVQRNGRGFYTVNFTNTYSASAYAVVASCKEKATIGNISSLTEGYFVWTRPVNYTNTSVDIRCGIETNNPNDRFQANNNADVGVVSVVIYSN